MLLVKLVVYHTVQSRFNDNSHPKHKEDKGPDPRKSYVMDDHQAEFAWKGSGNSNAPKCGSSGSLDSNSQAGPSSGPCLGMGIYDWNQA